MREPLASTVRSQRRLATTLAVGALLAASGALLLKPGSSPSRAAGVVVPLAARSPAPPLTGPVLVPPPISLESPTDRVLFVNFWASWCRPCRQEAPELARFASGLRRTRGILVGVDVNDQPREALGFLRRFGLHGSQVRDPHANLVAAYRLLGLPTTVVIDGNGKIAARLLGPQTAESLRDVLRRVRAGT